MTTAADARLQPIASKLSLMNRESIETVHYGIIYSK